MPSECEEMDVTPETIPELSTEALQALLADTLPLVHAAVEELQRRHPGAKLTTVQ